MENEERRILETVTSALRELNPDHLTQAEMVDLRGEIIDRISQGKSPRSRMRFTRAAFAAVFAAAFVICSVALFVMRQPDRGPLPMSASAIQKLLPRGAKLMNNGKGASILAVDLGGDGTSEYAALFRNPNGTVGAVLVSGQSGHARTLWQYRGPIGLALPANLSIADLFHNGNKELVFQAAIGAMAKQIDILTWSKGGVASIFTAQATKFSIGPYNGRNRPDLIATWTLNTGNLYNIQLYGWDQPANRYTAIPGTSSPAYFRSAVIPYYSQLQKTASDQAPKMTSYGLASAYYNAGEYRKALSETDRALRFGASAYPPDSELRSLQRLIKNRMTKTRTRGKAP